MSFQVPVYFDHNATTPLDRSVLEAMMPWLTDRWGNASSRHAFGQFARQAIDTARQQVAAAVDADPEEVYFTSGGSEANNLFLKGVMSAHSPGIVAVSAVEHACVLQPVRQMLRRGWQLRLIAVDAQGQVDENDFIAALQEKPSLISVMTANNETGVVQDIAKLAGHVTQGWFHSDAIQAFGKIPLSFRQLNRAGVHALVLSSHKIYGPAGAAALVLDKRIDLAPLIAGGGQERGLRSGTENVAAIVGFGAACVQVRERLCGLPEKLRRMRDRLETEVAALGARLFAAQRPRLPNTAYFAFPGIRGDALLAELDRRGFMVASGSACSDSDPRVSHVLSAMKVAPELARGALRISLGADNDEAQVDAFIAALRQILDYGIAQE